MSSGPADRRAGMTDLALSDVVEGGAVKGGIVRRKGIEASTGRDYGSWFALLDQWGAPQRPYREIADWLVTEHGLSRWWAQKLVVHYQQERGLRAPGVRPDGTFSVSASKTIGVPVARAQEAFADARQRKRWLSKTGVRTRTSTAGGKVRLDWGDGTSISVIVDAKGNHKSQVAVEHQRLPSAEAARDAKTRWQQRLTELKAFLEHAGNPSSNDDPAVQAYIDAIDPAHRAPFDRIHRLVLATCPDVKTTISYEIPTYVVGKRRLYVGAWKHGISLYGWSDRGDGGFTERHPELRHAKGTIRLRPRDADELSDDELRSLIEAVLTE